MWVTDMGWIMGPFEVVGAGALGATLVIGEGAPDYPAPTACGTWSSATGSACSVSRRP